MTETHLGRASGTVCPGCGCEICIHSEACFTTYKRPEMPDAVDLGPVNEGFEGLTPYDLDDIFETRTRKNGSRGKGRTGYNS